MKLFYRTCNDDRLVRHELVVPDNALADLEIESGGQVFCVAASEDGLRIYTDGSIYVRLFSCNTVAIGQEESQ